MNRVTPQNDHLK